MGDRKYTRDMLPKLSLERFLRRDPERFFGSPGARPELIAGKIAEGALILGAKDVSIQSADGWWYVCADEDWLRKPTPHGVGEIDIFFSLCAFPELGRNCHRSEAIAVAFSDAVFTVGSGSIARVKGDLPSDDEIHRQISGLREFARVVAFHYEHDA